MIKLIVILLTIISAAGQGEYLINPFWTVSGGNNLSSGVVAYYKFDEASGNALDDTGGGKHLTEFGTPDSAAGRVSTSREMTVEGTDYFMHNDDAVFDPANGSYTIAFWVYFNAVPAEGESDTIISKYVDGDTNSSYAIDAITLGGITFFQFSILQSDGSGLLNYPQIQFTMATNTPYCVVARIDADNLEVKLDIRATGDGVWLMDNEPYDGTVTDSTASLAIGGLSETTTTLDAATLLDSGGRIDELGFWNRSLSDCERDNFYNAGLGRARATYNSLTCN